MFSSNVKKSPLQSLFVPEAYFLLHRSLQPRHSFMLNHHCDEITELCSVIFSLQLSIFAWLLAASLHSLSQWEIWHTKAKRGDNLNSRKTLLTHFASQGYSVSSSVAVGSRNNRMFISLVHFQWWQLREESVFIPSQRRFPGCYGNKA